MGQLFDKKFEVCTGSTQTETTARKTHAREKGVNEPKCKKLLKLREATSPYAHAGRGDARW